MTRQLPDFILEHTILPVIAAPMFLVTGFDLVLASCLSGVICAFPCPNARTIAKLEEWMHNLNVSLNKAKIDFPDKKIAPWAVNMIVHKSYSRFNEELALLKKYKPKIVITALGSPIRVIDTVHNYGGLVYADVNSLSFAKKAALTGVDGLILVAAGAGGHTGQMTGFAFVEAVREFWDGHLILGGGISTGRSIRAAQVLGADLAYMGTKFIATEESMAPDEYCDMLAEATGEDIILTDAITGVKAYFLKASLIKAGYDVHHLVSKKVNFDDVEGQESKAWKNVWSAGQGVGTIHRRMPVKQLIKMLQEEYLETLNFEKIN